MKKQNFFRKTIIISMVTAVFFLLGSCENHWIIKLTDPLWDDETTPVPSTYTVTFKDGYGTTLKTETVAHGGNATAPANPTVTGKYNSKFVAWDKGFTNITSATTVNATWTNYAVGDTGPGGGTIFYVDPDGFTMTDDNSTAYYLEAAPEDTANLQWAESGTWVATNLIGTSADIGAGRRNTARIIAAAIEHDGSASAAPSANACDTYVSPNGTDDWFLPSHNELKELVAIRDIGNFQYDTSYNSSTEYSATAYQRYVIDPPTQYLQNDKVLNTDPARPIRAF